MLYDADILKTVLQIVAILSIRSRDLPAIIYGVFYANAKIEGIFRHQSYQL